MPHGHATYQYAQHGQDHYRDDSDDDLYPPPPPRNRRVNPLAVLALVLGLFGWVMVSIPCGVVALHQIKQTGQKGRDVAIAGLTFSGLWVAGFALVVLVAVLEASSG